MIFHIQQCFSGEFIDDLSDLANVQCTNREVHAACEPDEYSTSEVWVTYEGSGQPNLNTVNFTEYLFYWNAAARGYFPDFDQPWLNITEYTVGEFPLEDYIPGHDGNWNPDTNNDGIVTMGEAHEYAHWMDTWSYHGVFIPFWENLPSHYYHSPDPFYNIQFSEDILTLLGLTGEIIYSQSVQGIFSIGGPISITSPSSLTLLPNTNLYFINDVVMVNGEEVEVGFTVPANCSLILQNDVSFYGYGSSNSIIIQGDIEFGQNNQFLSLSGNTWEGINLLNETANIAIYGATFEHCGISGNTGYLNLDNLDFTNGFIDLEATNVDLDYSIFDQSNFRVLFGDRTSFVNLNNCRFSNSLKDAIHIDRYYKYGIRNCTINNCNSGIKVFNSGSGPVASIYSNNIFDNNQHGVVIYNSHASFRQNEIRNNSKDGISLHDNSFVRLTGNDQAHFVSETQRFRDNGMYEIFTDEGSFPEVFIWNAIIDEDNNLDGYELVYCETSQSEQKDVSYNYWGSDEAFDPYADLYPSGDYNWFPKFKLEDDENDSGIAETMFYSAENDFELGNYTSAKSGYLQIVEQYPENKFAKASIKQLFSVEEYATNDYNALSLYLRTNNIILSNPELEKLADFFANKCDIKNENWQVAVDWFEDQIQNPKSFADSLYAVIDLGNTYLLMEQSGFKSTYSGKMIELIPTSIGQYNIKRDFLISLLPQTKLSNGQKEALNGLAEKELLQNTPNPFSGTTEIWYKLGIDSDVKILIHNNFGQLIRSFDLGKRIKGDHNFKFNGSGLPDGIYFYSVEVNGKISDSKKMIILK